MSNPETREEIKAIKNRKFLEPQNSLNPTMYPSKQIDKRLYEDLIERGAEFGLGSVLVEKLSVFEEGATLLDHFAGIAMSRFLEKRVQNSGMLRIDSSWAEQASEDSYQLASVMLKARTKALAELSPRTNQDE